MAWVSPVEKQVVTDAQQTRSDGPRRLASLPVAPHLRALVPAMGGR